MSGSRALALWGPVVAAMAVIFIVSSQSDPPLPEGMSDKQGHSIGYSALGVLVARAMAGGLGASMSPLQAAASVAATTAYGASDEWHQSFVPGRESDVADVWADAVGATFGTATCWAWGIIRSRSDV